ncbi:MAG TPA: hypothetical protein VF681_13495 [Abditibacteriaceae bacterium]|jgi:hypothetical protein
MAVLLILCSALIGFAVLWSLICVLISLVNGWRRLAAKFPASAKPAGRTFLLQRAHFNGAQYSGCLTVTAGDLGLYLAVWPLFPGHAPLLIPWHEFTPFHERKVLWSRSWETRVRLGQHKNIRISLYEPTRVAEIERQRNRPENHSGANAWVSATAPPIPDVPPY